MAAPAHPAPSGAFATHIGGSAEQQDRAVILTLPDGTILSVVADGHGPHGARAAEWAVHWIVAHHHAPFGDAGCLLGDAAATFASIDEHIHARLLAHLEATGAAHMSFGKGIYRPGLYGMRGLPIRGGTTLSVALVSPDGHVAAAHVGDSDIHVFDEHADAEGVSLMGDHTVTSRAEFDRIRALHPGARFVMEASAVGLPAWHDRAVWTKKAADGTFELNPLGPFISTDVREGWGGYLKAADDSEGLAMTRALGDFNLQLLAGVSIEPHCQELPALEPSAAPRERVVVNASDGFWDIVHYAEAAEVIWRPENRGSAEATAAALLALGKAKAVERLGALGDNITVSVIRVLAPRPAPAAAAAPEGVAVGGAGAGAAAPEPGDSLVDPALWEAAVQRYDPTADNTMPLGHSANTMQLAEGQEAMVSSGAVPGTGFLYFGRGSTQRIIYRSLDGRYWDIVYRRFEEDAPDYNARWRIVGARPWYHSIHGPALPEPLAAVAVAAPPPLEPAGGAGAADDEGPYATKEIRPCGCPMSLFINPKNGRTVSETLHGMMVRSGECKRLDWPKKPP